MITPNDPIISRSRGSVEQLLAAAREAGCPRMADTERYAAALWDICEETGIDFAVAASQWHLETGGGTSWHWVNRLNPGGIGVTDGDDVSIDYKTGENAAAGQCLHLWAYATTGPVPEGLADLLHLDPRFSLVRRGSATTIQGLQGRWATDPDYAKKVCARGNKMFPGARPAPGPGPDAAPGPVFGNVARPAWQDRLIPDSANVAWDDLGPRQVRGVVLHRQQGINWGTDNWFRTLWQPNGQKGGGQMALTDFGLDSKSGELLRWNDQTGQGYPDLGISPNRTPWASGPWQNPPGDGRALVAKYGVASINRDLVSIEIDGYYDGPVSPAAFEQLCRLVAWLADQARVPWEEFPFNPHTGIVFTFWHNEFTAQKPCPGKTVAGITPKVQERVKQILREAQLGSAPQPGPQPQPRPQPNPAPLPDPAPELEDAVLSWAFGEAMGDDGITYVFDPQGPVSRAWRDRVAAGRGAAPLLRVGLFGQDAGTRRKMFQFADGTLIEWSETGGARTVSDPD